MTPTLWPALLKSTPVASEAGCPLGSFSASLAHSIAIKQVQETGKVLWEIVVFLLYFVVQLGPSYAKMQVVDIQAVDLSKADYVIGNKVAQAN